MYLKEKYKHRKGTLIEHVSKADELNKRLYSLAQVGKFKEYTTGI